MNSSLVQGFLNLFRSKQTSANFNPDEDIADLSGKIIIVTGANIGLGLETVRQLAKHNPTRIYLAARSESKAQAAIKQIQETNPDAAPMSFLSLDLSSFESVIAAAKTFLTAESRLDILVNNAGIMMVPEGQTKEGYEIHFGTNHMGHALFTQLLLPTLQKTAQSGSDVRVVNLSSGASQSAPNDIYDLAELKTPMANRHIAVRYCISKIANIHFTIALAQRYEGIKFLGVDPGVVQTELANKTTGFLMILVFKYIVTPLLGQSVEKGALNQLYAATSPQVRTGDLLCPVCKPWKVSKPSTDSNLADQLWDWTQKEIEAYL